MKDNLEKVQWLLDHAQGANWDYTIKRAQTFALLDIATSLRAIREKLDNG